MSRADLIAFDQPAAPASDGEITFINIWNAAEDPGHDMRGWSDARIEDLIKNLQALESLRLEIVPAHEPPFYGTP